MVEFYGRHVLTTPITALAASCYIQGVEDVYSAIEKKPPQPIHFVPEKPARFRPM
jgi:phosphatidate phosphatase APP1